MTLVTRSRVLFASVALAIITITGILYPPQFKTHTTVKLRIVTQLLFNNVSIRGPESPSEVDSNVNLLATKESTPNVSAVGQTCVSGSRPPCNSRVPPLPYVPGTVRTKRILVCFDWPAARLGNKMFQYAATLGIALNHNLPTLVIVDTNEKRNGYQQMKSLFRLTLESTTDGELLRKAEMVTEPGWGIYNTKVAGSELFSKPVVTFGGYLQSWKYFSRYEREIRQEYNLNSEYERQASSFLHQVPSQNLSMKTVFIGMHVRRGDMLSFPNLYTTASSEYIGNALKYYITKYGVANKLVFVVATDDRNWVKKTIAEHGIDGNSAVYSFASAELDLAILSKCNHSIVTVGTFGWWSAFLAGGEVVYYKDFIKSDSVLFKDYREDDYYPPSWIGMS